MEVAFAERAGYFGHQLKALLVLLLLLLFGLVLCRYTLK